LISARVALFMAASLVSLSSDRPAQDARAGSPLARIARVSQPHAFKP